MRFYVLCYYHPGARYFTNLGFNIGTPPSWQTTSYISNCQGSGITISPVNTAVTLYMGNLEDT